jgi:D-glutamate cyclase
MISDQQKEYCRNIAEIIDRLITVQFCMSGGGATYTEKPITQELYNAARRKFEDPLTYTAAIRLLERVQPGDTVMIVTGFIVAPWMRPETDGPVGAASLARALNICFSATPMIVTEYENIDIFKPVFETTGLQIVSVDNPLRVPRQLGFVPFPIDSTLAVKKATDVLDRLKPSAIISIEKASGNSKGVYHNGHGMDVSNLSAKTDILINDAKRRGILTIGIGDGGNEIGMGLIADTVRKVVPTAANCVCPCQSGIGAATETDALIVGAVANWGSYGLETCLAIASDTPKVLHNGAFERFILEASIRAGMVDPATGLSEGHADGVDTEINVYLIEMLNKIIEYKNPNSWRKRSSSAWRKNMAAVTKEIEVYGQFLLNKEREIFKDLL